MDIREILAINLRRMRQERRLSQEELADRAQLDRTYISALERGIYYASIKTIDKLARTLDAEPAAFLQRPAKAGRPRT